MDLVPEHDLPESVGEPVKAAKVVPEHDLPSAVVPEHDLPDEGKEVPEHDLPGNPHSTPSEQVLTGLEGVAHGLGGPLATAAELGLSKMGVKGLSAEEQTARREANPWIHGGGQAVGLGLGMFTGTGEAALATNIAERLAPTAVTTLGKVGSTVLKGAIANGLIQGGDEISKAMLGQGDPEAPVSSALVNIGASGLLGGVTAGVFHGSASGLKRLGEAKAGTNAQEFLAGIGDAAKPGQFFPEGAEVSKMYKSGQEFYNKGLQSAIGKTAKTATAGAAAAADLMHGGSLGESATVGTSIHRFLGPKIEEIVGKKLTPAAQKLAFPVVMKVLSSGETSGLWQALDHAAEVSRGAQKINGAMDNLFQLGTQRVVDEVASELEREKIKEFLENGGVQQQIKNQQGEDQNAQGTQAFAKGGSVKPQAQAPEGDLSTHYPEQAMLMAAAKGRVSNYLNSLRPQKNAPKLPFDSSPPDHMQEKKYNRAIDLAAKPLSILNKVKNGSITLEEMNHFHQLYPDVYNQISKKMTEKITEQQLKGEKPHYKTRQGLSVFLGAPMDLSFTPESIIAAQSVFANKKMGSGPTQPSKSKKGTSKLDKMDDQFQTAQQAAAERQTKD